MTICRRGLLLLLLLLTAHPGPSKAQHWSHGWYPGGKRAWGLQQAPVLPAPAEESAPWESRAVIQQPFRGKQRVAQTLLVSWVAKGCGIVKGGKGTPLRCPRCTD
ncbi:PREDICTED: progonadoliberin-2 [Elephantulus edwardii]|uniref:progonadoliberin-2 n=1 Tax=Elephantulus edwardii TaxID=28737 RepID=UPI0003F07D30|nr:PREDICTED: progonadoliberin-2 [Elephantulus edwardii]